MWVLAIRELSAERGRLIVSALGVAAALVLVLLLGGVFAGTSEQIVAYPKNAGADVWVMQDGVSNMHMVTSVFPRERERDVAAVDGVDQVTPIMYVNNFVIAGGRDYFSYIVGIEPGSTRGGPWSMRSGTPAPDPGQAVIPVEIADNADLSLGDSVNIMGRSFVIAGLSRDAYSMANSVTFLHYADVSELMQLSGKSSYLLVAAKPGVSARVLASRINGAVGGVNAMARSDFVDSDRAMALLMGADIIRLMTLVAFAVSVLIIGFTIYTSTVRRERQHAVAKALGASNASLFVVTLAQAMITTFAGLLLALGLALGLRPLIHSLVPEVRVLYPLGNVLRLFVVSVVVGVVASWLPARRVMRVDPALAFRE